MDNNRLDETVKKTLRNYEVPYNDSDWVQMESMLDVAPKHNPLRRSYSPVIIFALVIVGAAFLLYAVFQPSETSEQRSTTYTPPIVKKKSPELKPAETHPVVPAPVVPPVKKEIPAPVKTITTRSVTVAPAVTSIKKDVKKMEKKMTEKKIAVDKTATPPVIPVKKNSNPSTLSSQESKAKLFSKTIEKNIKTSTKEEKPVVKQAENDTVHIDDENDSNRNRKALKSDTNTTGGSIDSLKNSQEKKTGTQESKKETRKSKKGKKTDTLQTGN